jgi:hypothetical protein
VPVAFDATLPVASLEDVGLPEAFVALRACGHHHVSDRMLVVRDAWQRRRRGVVFGADGRSFSALRVRFRARTAGAA